MAFISIIESVVRNTLDNSVAMVFGALLRVFARL